MRLLITLALLTVPAASFAQTTPTRQTVYEDETTYDFEDDYVEGQLVRPDGELVTGQRHGKESSLVRIRADFIPEMVQSVEDL